MIKHKYVVVGAGVAGSCVSHFLKGEDVLLIDRRADVAGYASGAAGGFLSPLLGKPNDFKRLVTKSLKFAIDFYKDLDESLISQTGVLRIPKNNEDKKKFLEYEKYMDFEYSKIEDGYYFPIGAQVNPYKISKKLVENINTRFNYDIKHIKYIENKWVINDEIEAENLILTTGCDLSILDEEYIKIRAVWGQRLDIQTTTCINKNYHKECSVSTSYEIDKKDYYKCSIGATHHRFKEKGEIFKVDDVIDYKDFSYTNELYKQDTQDLLEKANDIVKLDDVKITKKYFAPRACSVDYFPIVGNIIDSQKTINRFPYLKNGTHVNDFRFINYDKLFILNGVGGRGYVLSPYLAKNLVELIKNNEELETSIVPNRLFKKWVRRLY